MSNQIYVSSSTPKADIETFITNFKIDENFVPLSRMLRRYARNLVPSTVLAATVPSAFVTGNWSIAKATTTSATVTITTIPASNGSDVGLIEYSVNGGAWRTLAGGVTTGARTITGLTANSTPSIRLRAVNALGAAAAGDAKTVDLSA